MTNATTTTTTTTNAATTTTRPPARRKAPGPRRPFGVRRFRVDAARILVDLRREYGDVARFRVGPELMHQVAGPEAIQEILHDADGYRRGKVYHGFELFFGKGSLTADGREWKTLRTTGQPFFRNAFLDPNVPAIADAVTNVLDRLREPASKGEPIDIVPEMMRLAFDVVTRVLCGCDLRHRADDVIPAIVHVLSAMFPGSPELLLPRWLPGPHRRRLRATQTVLDDAVSELIALHRSGRIPPDRLVGALHAAHDPDSGSPLTRRQVMDELKTHLLAGHETTGCGLSWTLYELARNPAAQRRVAAEVADVLGGRPPTAEDLTELTYLKQVVSEALRLHPPIPMFPREPVRDVEIGGYHIPAGSTVFISPYTVHHDPRHWTDPETFDPDRFAPDRPTPTRYTYLPFGGGRRRCIGAPLAEIEIRVAVAMVVQRYRLSRPSDDLIDAHSLISLRPRHGLPMTLTDLEEGS